MTSGPPDTEDEAEQPTDDQTEERPEPGHVRSLSIATAFAIVGLWLVPLFSSLWVDELGTWWVVKDGLGDAVDRAFRFHGQSPLYYAIVWAFRTVGGNSEAVLRLPSLIAAAVSVVLLYRLARTLIGREAARLAVLVFAAGQVVAFEASEARPYAMATTAVIASTYVLVRWLDDGHRWDLALGYALLAVTVVWLHYLFALALVPHALYAFMRLRRRETEVPVRRLAAVALLVTAGVLPLAVQLASLWDRRSSLSIPSDGSVAGLAFVLVPPVLAASLFLGSLLARAQGRVLIEPVRARSSTLVLLSSWLVFPVVTLYLVSALTPLTFLSPRYFASVAPAAALIAGWGVASLQPAAARRIVAIALALLSILAFGGTLKNGEDWQGAAAFEREHADPDTIVLVHPALVESAQLDWFSDPEKRSYLLSVQSYYPMVGRVTPMPYVLDDAARGYLEGLVTGELAGVDRFLLVTRYTQVPYRDWLDGRLTPDGYRSTVIGTFGVITIFEFSRSA
jgi:4-amino-4-deoxy-L-arabinose transferase-like glycosyltransferase